jgi:hypothetical protein
MPAIGPERPAPAQKVVHVARDTDCDSTHAARKRSLVLRFNDQVNVIALNRKVNDTKSFRSAAGRAD